MAWQATIAIAANAATTAEGIAAETSDSLRKIAKRRVTTAPISFSKSYAKK